MKICVVLFLALTQAQDFSEEDDVLVLTDQNIDAALADNSDLLVEFYAPWCGHCRKLAPEYAAAAKRLKENYPPVRIAKIDATVNTEAAKKYEVKGYPALKWFVKGKVSDFEGARTEDAIVGYVLKKIGQSLSKLKDLAAVKKFQGNNKICAIIFGEEDTDEYINFQTVVKGQEGIFYGQTNHPDALSEYSVTAPAVVIFKHIDDKRVDFDGDLTSFLEVQAWLESNQTPWVLPFDDTAIAEIFTKQKPALFMFRKSGSELQTIFEQAASQVRKDIILSYADVGAAEFSRLAEYLGVSGADQPCLFIVVPTNTGVGKYKDTSDITVESIKAFVQEWKSGSLKPSYKSAKIPADPYDGNVRIVVGKNFDEVVFDKTKDVLMEFYAPWCGHCKSLAPEYEKAAAALRKTMPDVVLAKCDATENEIPDYPVQGFPTLGWFPTDNKVGVEYEGPREADGIIEWVKEHGTTKKIEGEEEKIQKEDL